MSSPPVSKQTPLPTSVTFWIVAIAPDEIDQPRGLVPRPRPTAWIKGKATLQQRVALDHRQAGLVRTGEDTGRLLKAVPGPCRLAGVLMRSRARKTALACELTAATSTPGTK